MVLDQDIIMTNLAADTREDVIRAVTAKMKEKGYVGDGYCSAVLEREESYPTGLPSEGVMTAVPHAFCGEVYRTGVGIASLVKPVLFKNTVDPEEELPVELVFVMANESGEDAHLGDLQELMAVFSKKQLLLDLKHAKSPSEFAKIFSNCDDYPDGF